MEIIDGDWGEVAIVVAVTEAVVVPNPVAQNTAFRLRVEVCEGQEVRRPILPLSGMCCSGAFFGME